MKKESYTSDCFIIRTVVLSIIILTSQLGCQNIRSDVADVNEPAVFDLKESRMVDGSMQRTVSSISRNLDSSLEWQVHDVGIRSDLFGIQFASADFGWISPWDDSILQTQNGGELWQKTSYGDDSSAYLMTPSFFDEKKGWVARIKEGDERGTGPSWSEILFTSDSGQHWKRQFFDKRIEISSILVVSENEIWASGTRMIKSNIVKGEYLLLRTVNGGNDWEDLSSLLLRQVPNREGNIDSISSLGSINKNSVVVYTDDGDIFETTDAGKKWQNLGRMTFGNKSVEFVNRHDGRIGISGGIGRHGKSGVVANRSSDGKWQVFEIPKAYVTGLVYITNDVIVACGSMSSGYLNSDDDSSAVGIILLSKDGGKNWRIVYKNDNKKRINSIIAVGEKVWAVGDKGLVVSTSLIDIMK